VVRVPGYRSGGLGFDSRALQGKKVAGLERGPLSLVSTTELLGRNSSGSGLERREYGRRDSSRWTRGTLYPQKKKMLALISLTSGGRSVGIVRLRTEAMEFFLVVKRRLTHELTRWGQCQCCFLWDSETVYITQKPTSYSWALFEKPPVVRLLNFLATLKSSKSCLLVPIFSHINLVHTTPY
jgi:hypothetical protein